MKNFNLFHFSKMTSNDFFEFHGSVLKAAATVTDREFVDLLGAYELPVVKFGLYFKDTTEITAKRVAAGYGRTRTETYFEFRSFVGTLRNHPDESTRNLGCEIWAVIEQFGSKISHKNGTISAIVENTLKRIDQIVTNESYVAAYTQTGLEKWAKLLAEQQTAYRESMDVCLSERSHRKQDSNYALRDECMVRFYRLVHYADYCAAVKGDEACEKFLGKVMSKVNMTRSELRTRTKRNAKAKGELSKNVAA